jgi:hypothetical protein
MADKVFAEVGKRIIPTYELGSRRKIQSFLKSVYTRVPMAKSILFPLSIKCMIELSIKNIQLPY